MTDLKKSIIGCLFLILVQPTILAQEAWLFAHMTTENYGGLYYSVSTDGLYWQLLNNGKTVEKEYRGHPDIMRGHDGRYYMIGVEENTGKLFLWTSVDLLTWKKERELPASVFLEAHGHKANPSWYGAPKLFYDNANAQYLITWHMPLQGISRDDFVDYWCSMRTFVTVTNDFKTFTPARKLFDFDMGTIDVIIRKEGDLYYALLKDECEATAQWPTGKSIRVSVSAHATGPYSYPSAKISGSYREAPMVIPKSGGEGWYMYYEQYPGLQYEVSESPALGGPWFDVWSQRVNVPQNARHGAMIEISKEDYLRIIGKYKYE